MIHILITFGIIAQGYIDFNIKGQSEYTTQGTGMTYEAQSFIFDGIDEEVPCTLQVGFTYGSLPNKFTISDGLELSCEPNAEGFPPINTRNDAYQCSYVMSVADIKKFLSGHLMLQGKIFYQEVWISVKGKGVIDYNPSGDISIESDCSELSDAISAGFDEMEESAESLPEGISYDNLHATVEDICGSEKNKTDICPLIHLTSSHDILINSILAPVKNIIKDLEEDLASGGDIDGGGKDYAKQLLDIYNAFNSLDFPDEVMPDAKMIILDLMVLISNETASLELSRNIMSIWNEILPVIPDSPEQELQANINITAPKEELISEIGASLSSVSKNLGNVSGENTQALVFTERLAEVSTEMRELTREDYRLNETTIDVYTGKCVGGLYDSVGNKNYNLFKFQDCCKRRKPQGLTHLGIDRNINELHFLDIDESDTFYLIDQKVWETVDSVIEYVNWPLDDVPILKSFGQRGVGMMYNGVKLQHISSDAFSEVEDPISSCEYWNDYILGIHESCYHVGSVSSINNSPSNRIAYYKNGWKITYYWDLQTVNFDIIRFYMLTRYPQSDHFWINYFTGQDEKGRFTATVVMSCPFDKCYIIMSQGDAGAAEDGYIDTYKGFKLKKSWSAHHQKTCTGTRSYGFEVPNPYDPEGEKYFVSQYLGEPES